MNDSLPFSFPDASGAALIGGRALVRVDGGGRASGGRERVEAVRLMVPRGLRVGDEGMARRDPVSAFAAVIRQVACDGA